jgi:AcrR family transcriptional regulator
MKPDRGTTAESARTRAALLDAAEQIMMEEGYAAVSSRRVASRAGVNQGLVYYYFGTMDDLFIALFQRGADQSFHRQAEALSADQPLWRLWELIHDQPRNALTMEFVALANHRKAIKSEISSYSQRFRKMQVDAVCLIFKEYGVPPEVCTPTQLVLLMSSISRFLLMEEAFGIDTGHDEMIRLVEKYLRDIEGERRRSATGRSRVSG